ncbi:MAG TPA: hypothetical protein VF765_31380 [Polyangiaceae bacterium]
MQVDSDAAACSFCGVRTKALIAGRRAGTSGRGICMPCARALRAEAAGAKCDFCDHPDGSHARRGEVTICAGCLDLAREVAHDSEAPAAGPEGHLDTAQLWSELTPAPVPVVDGDAPATAHAELALVLLQMGLVDEARAETQKALSMDASHAIALRVQAKLGSLPR